MRRLLLLALLLVVPALKAQPLTLHALVDSTHAAGRFDGAVLVFDGQRTMAATAGLADREARTPWTLATRSPWASVSKLITASLVLRHVEAGRLRLDDDARAWLPALRTGPKTTLRHLLAHMSGLATGSDVENLYDRATLAATRAAMDSVLAGPRRDAPGASWRYNNLDYIAMERLVADVEGRPYASAVTRRLLRPLGLRSVQMGEGGQTVGYAVDSTGAATPVRLSANVLAGFGAAGGFVGDVRDLLRLGRALADGRLLSPALRDTLTAALPNARSALSVWTYEAETHDGRRVRVIERQGWIAGNRALLLVVPETGSVVAVLANTDVSDLGSTASGEGFSAALLGLALRR